MAQIVGGALAAAAVIGLGCVCTRSAKAPAKAPAALASSRADLYTVSMQKSGGFSVQDLLDAAGQKASSLNLAAAAAAAAAKDQSAIVDQALAKPIDRVGFFTRTAGARLGGAGPKLTAEQLTQLIQFEFDIQVAGITGVAPPAAAAAAPEAAGGGPAAAAPPTAAAAGAAAAPAGSGPRDEAELTSWAVGKYGADTTVIVAFSTVWCSKVGKTTRSSCPLPSKTTYAPWFFLQNQVQPCSMVVRPCFVWRGLCFCLPCGVPSAVAWLDR